MKTIFFILLPFILFSCIDNSEVVTHKTFEYPKPFHFHDDNSDKMTWVIIIGQDNHEYLRNCSGSAFVLIHYPDCKKCIKNNSIEQFKNK